MFKDLFKGARAPLSEWSLSEAEQQVLGTFPSREDVAVQLASATTWMPLSLAQARLVVLHMRPRRMALGTVFIQEGDATNTGLMFFVLSGEVIIEAVEYTRDDPMTVTVLGPGSMLGELALLDGSPRSASCTAGAELCCVTLDRPGLQALLAEQPEIGARLVMAMAMRMAERLRDNTVKLKKYVQLTRMLQDELEHRKLRTR
ncbi:cyclic nucleotide-binding domain-containing protein [Rhodoferax sp. PAMC 29310]|uniref:cyclic nucleotide-binding domain-containing protein n=1 Tax=Rhodoferax sp. PAMC 29310 TaxID=2822760 RepID=UPI001B32DF9B|nr:cyclic nucleotide-binding domain-containing protein [Rhodoferax sp. PAMC 29310]